MEDEASNLTVLEMEMGLQAFADLLTNRSFVKMDAKLNIDPDIGKTHEVKTCWVRCPKDLRSLNDKDFATGLRKNIEAGLFEVDGWKADAVDHFNGYNYDNKTEVYKVIFRRYV